jgi:hypothetical protein
MDSQDRQSFKSFPGARINVTDEGISTPVSGASLRMSLNARGFARADETAEHAHKMPQVIAEGAEDSEFRKHYEHIELRRKTGSEPSERSEMRSADFCELTSAEMVPFKEKLAATLRERAVILQQIAETKVNQSRLSSMIWQHENRPAGDKPARGADEYWKAAAAESAKIAEYEDRLRATSVEAAAAVREDNGDLFENMCHSFASMASNSVIWDTVTAKNVTRNLRTCLVDASDVERRKVQFREDKFDAVECRWYVPHLQNANGGDIYIYPGFLLYYVDENRFSVISMTETRATLRETMFVENEKVPANATTSGFMQSTRVDGDGSDVSGSGGRDLPICKYASLTLSSEGGLNEGYMISNFSAAKAFSDDISALIANFTEK